MHELSLAQDIVDIIIDVQRRDGFQRVQAIHLQVGALAGVELPALEFAMQALCQQTWLQGAQLEIDQPMGKAQCQACDCTFDVKHRGEACPRCASHRQTLLTGHEFKLIDLLVE